VALPDRPDEVELEIVRLLTSTNPEEIETLADDLGRIGDRRAVGPLASRLADTRVHDDPDLEDAVCSSLVRLGAMDCSGNLNYSFVSPSRLNAEGARAPAIDPDPPPAVLQDDPAPLIQLGVAVPAGSCSGSAPSTTSASSANPPTLRFENAIAASSTTSEEAAIA
jgi:hypothetical protein